MQFRDGVPCGIRAKGTALTGLKRDPHISGRSHASLWHLDDSNIPVKEGDFIRTSAVNSEQLISVFIDIVKELLLWGRDQFPSGDRFVVPRIVMACLARDLFLIEEAVFVNNGLLLGIRGGCPQFRLGSFVHIVNFVVTSPERNIEKVKFVVLISGIRYGMTIFDNLFRLHPKQLETSVFEA